MEGRGGVPQELIDVSLCERFGWTWNELDEQDDARVLPAVAASNIHSALGRANSWVMRASQPGHQSLDIDPGDLAIWQMVTNLKAKDG